MHLLFELLNKLLSLLFRCHFYDETKAAKPGSLALCSINSDYFFVFVYLVNLTFASAVVWAEEIDFSVIFVNNGYSLDVLISSVDGLDTSDFSVSIKVNHFIVSTICAFLDEKWRPLAV